MIKLTPFSAQKELQEFALTLNKFGKNRRPALFGVSFNGSDSFVHPLDKLPPGMLYDFDGSGSSQSGTSHGQSPIDGVIPPDYGSYLEAFNEVQRHIARGNIYMMNLAGASEVTTSLTFTEIFHAARARFKLLMPERFVCFSPERFVRTQDGDILTYPIKGTIDASLPGAKETVLSDAKEHAEHTMVVDLLRNDLGIVGTGVQVERFRFVDEILAGRGRLLQVTSEIKARLPESWQNQIGTIFASLLPAGSVSGTPKSTACRIIEAVEPNPRGYFCGVAGLFDGQELDSCVLIRFIEKCDGRMFYRSGGGITVDSDPLQEYQELLRKVYVPVL